MTLRKSNGCWKFYFTTTGVNYIFNIKIENRWIYFKHKKNRKSLHALHSSGCLKGKAKPLSIAAICMAESFGSVHSDSWGQTCGKETQHLWLGSNHHYIHNITPAATWANRNAFAILNRSYVWRGVMFKELYCAYGRNCLSRHAMPIKKNNA